MKAFLAILFVVAVVSAETAKTVASGKKGKRGVGNFGTHGFNLDQFNSNALPSIAAPLWNPAAFAPSFWDPAVTSDLALGQVQMQAVHNLALQTLQEPVQQSSSNIAYSPEVLRAVQYAKEANHHVQLAQHRVNEAKQAAIWQQKVALSKEAAAREAAQRSAEITAQAEAEARASAKQLVALQQRLATLKDAVAAAQRLAAAREAAAAAAIQRSAADTAAELRKQDVDKQISQSEHEARTKDIIAAKENAISHALHNNAVQRQHVPGAAAAAAQHPWG